MSPNRWRIRLFGERFSAALEKPHFWRTCGNLFLLIAGLIGTSWVIAGVRQLPSFLDLPAWLMYPTTKPIYSLSSLLFLTFTGLALRRAASILSGGAWVSDVIPNVKRTQRGESVPQWLFHTSLTLLTSSIRALLEPRITAGLLGIVTALASVGLFMYAGHPPENGTPSRFLTLWQLHGGVVTVALPILIFIIHHGGQDPKERSHATEAFVRYTYVTPIFVILVGTLIAFGVATKWSAGQAYWAGIYLFAFAILLAGFAFVRLLTLIGDPSALDRVTTRILKNSFAEAVERSIAERVGRNIVRHVLNDNDATNMPFVPRPSDYVSLDVPCSGILVDIHLGRLEQFLQGLPKAPPTSTTPQSRRSSSGRGHDHPVIMTRNLRDTIPETDLSVIFLERDAFGTLDVGQLEAEVETFVLIKEVS